MGGRAWIPSVHRVIPEEGQRTLPQSQPRSASVTPGLTTLNKRSKRRSALPEYPPVTAYRLLIRSHPGVADSSTHPDYRRSAPIRVLPALLTPRTHSEPAPRPPARIWRSERDHW